MNNEIYIVRKSEYNEDYVLDFGYGLNMDDCFSIIEDYHEQYFQEKIVSFNVDEEKQIIYANDDEGGVNTFWYEKVKSYVDTKESQK